VFNGLRPNRVLQILIVMNVLVCGSEGSNRKRGMASMMVDGTRVSTEDRESGTQCSSRYGSARPFRHWYHGMS